MLFRYALLGSAVAILLACTGDSTLATGSASSTGGAGGTGGASPSACQDETECGDAQTGCIACAEQNECLAELNACNSSQDCLAFAQCLDTCTQDDEKCINACENQLALGGAIYHNLFVCVFCNVCFSTCDGETEGCTTT